MEVAFQIPDDLASRINASSCDLSRRALEAIALEEYQGGHITKPELRRLLGLGRIALDGFLKSRNVFDEYTLDDFEEERRALKDRGL